jgi:hypothetical protein
MATTFDYIRKPIGTIKEYNVGDSSNYHDTLLWVAGCTDLLIKLKNTDGVEGITVSIDWTLDIASGGDGYTDAIGSDPTIAAAGTDIFKFSSQYFVKNDGSNDHTPVDPAFAGVLPCSIIRIRVYATTATETSSFKMWIQGVKQRL